MLGLEQAESVQPQPWQALSFPMSCIFLAQMCSLQCHEKPQKSNALGTNGPHSTVVFWVWKRSKWGCKQFWATESWHLEAVSAAAVGQWDSHLVSRASRRCQALPFRICGSECGGKLALHTASTWCQMGKEMGLWYWHLPSSGIIYLNLDPSLGRWLLWLHPSTILGQRDIDDIAWCHLANTAHTKTRWRDLFF